MGSICSGIYESLEHLKCILPVFFIDCIVSIKHFPGGVSSDVHDHRFWHPGFPHVGVESVASYDIIKINLRKFNQVFGTKKVGDITPAALQNYQARRKQEGKAPGTIDHEIGKAKTMINKARENDLVTGKTKKAFDRVKKTLVSGSDVRDRILSKDEFESLVKHSTGYLKGMVIMGYYTGMRRGEILSLTWGHVDLADRVIRLEPEDTKSGKPRDVPLCDELHNYLSAIKKKRVGKLKHVFLYRGKPIKGDVRASLKIACQKAGISYGRFIKNGFIFHDLRYPPPLIETPPVLLY